MCASTSITRNPVTSSPTVTFATPGVDRSERSLTTYRHGTQPAPVDLPDSTKGDPAADGSPFAVSSDVWVRDQV